jgi:NAD(P)-dependent dehydrogenase (short-subunit alcohol dehydrogenase family)
LAAPEQEALMDLELTGKRALVTGGSRGIGKAIAMELAREGADVAIAARDQARIDATVAEIASASGRKVFGTTLDAADADSITEMVRASAEAIGGIDILVNAAARPGGQQPAPRWDAVTEEALFEELQVKVLGYLRVAQAAAPFMIEQGWGRIINISGMAARQTGTVIGSVRNVAVSALSKNLADELAPHGINVVTVHPGTTKTEATTAEAAARPATNLVGRMIDATEVAYVVTFLASPKSVAIDGDTIAAGGGVPKVIYY